MTDISQIKQNLADTHQQIHHWETYYNRASSSVSLLAVSKTKPVSAIQAAYQEGQRSFGENYVQEAVEKKQLLNQLSDIEWHFIGPIQSNKSRLVAESMDWVHTVDREKIARRLSEQRPAQLAPLKVCIQINISGEISKSGILLEQLDEMVDLVVSLPNLELKGLMAIPAPAQSVEQQIEVYRPLQQAFLALQNKLEGIDTLSIGMSGDLQAAIASGSSMVRVGTGIFGARDYGVQG
ncbi:YggS family pyridoxal phosphate-dependent enzyme [Marinomonas epiphytica]